VRRIKGYREFRQQMKRLQKLQEHLAGDWKRLEKSLVSKS
jgi:DNA-binding ferritin-like protein (Dps family)